MGDLSDGVHARVRATRDGDDGTPSDSRRQERDRLFEDALDRAMTGLLGPPRESGAVVGDVQTEPDALAHNPRLYFAPCFAVIVQDAPGSGGERCMKMSTMQIPDPMLAKSVPEVPETGPKGAPLLFEPKWDGFRGIVSRTADGVVIGSRGAKTLERYFPELVDVFEAQLSAGTMLDGEIVVRHATAGGEKLDWETLSQRIHPAASRITRLAAETPASFVAFDLLAEDGESLLDAPLAERRGRLERLGEHFSAPLHISQTTEDVAIARRWLTEFEGAGLDGVVAKPLDAPYSPGKRTMLKIKHARTADCIVTGYRTHKSGSGVGSLLLSLYGEDGELHGVGGISAFTDKRRQELVEELAPLLARGEDGEAIRGESDRNRFSSSKDTSYAVLRPELVVEVRYDQMEGDRFRHTVQFERWRPDRDPASCTFAQLEVPAAYDLAALLP